MNIDPNSINIPSIWLMWCLGLYSNEGKPYFDININITSVKINRNELSFEVTSSELVNKIIEAKDRGFTLSPVLVQCIDNAFSISDIPETVEKSSIKKTETINAPYLSGNPIVFECDSVRIDSSSSSIIVQITARILNVNMNGDFMQSNAIDYLSAFKKCEWCEISK